MKRIGVFLIACVLVFGLAGCGGGGGDTTGTPMLVDTTVTVASEGGWAIVSFQGENGKTIRIVLSSASTVQPYGFLEPPSGTGIYTPPLETAQNGYNSSEVSLTSTGQYSLTVFDGMNAGGSVQVEISVVE